jgi:hypothetical protein
MAEMGDFIAPGEKKHNPSHSAANHDGEEKGPGTRILVEHGDKEREGHGKPHEAKEKADETKDASNLHQK